MLNKSITLNPDASTAQIIRTVQLAEELNFDTCYIADQGFTMDVYVTLTALACNTKRIRLGPGVTHPYTRHPVVSAVSIASLDQFSGGRAFLGVGAGGSRSLVPMQISRTKPVQMAREMVEIARQLWQEPLVNYKGEFFSLSNAKLGFPCRKDIEIHWAARAPKMLELGGELADVNLLFGIPRFDLENVIGTVRKGIKKTNRASRIHCAVNLVYDEPSREIARARTVYRLVDSTEEVKTKLGLSKEKVEEIRHLVSTTGFRSAAFLVTDEILSHFVIEGSQTACAKQIHDLVTTLGLAGITIEVPDPANAEKLLYFSAEVLSRI